jgi:metal transporter CNNM
MLQIDSEVNSNETSILLTVKAPPPSPGHTSTTLFFCYRRPHDNSGSFYHLGKDARIHVREAFMPTWLKIVVVLVCLSFSSLFSGLNLGLLSLNKTDLKIISNTGTDIERKYAKAIYPVRVHGNYLLCSILLGNVLVNSIFTILLDDMSSGMVAVVVSTLAIVICGEICPQAVCSRHGLAIGAKTIYITKTVMVLTAPLAWPLSRLLDLILGEEIATTYTRERLKELVKVSVVARCI